MKLNTLMGNHKITWEAPDTAGATPPTNESQASGAKPNPQTADQDTAAAPDYSWIPDTYQTDDGPDFAKFREDYDAGMAAKAQMAERNTPEDASGYDFALPGDLDFSDIEGLPENFTVKALTDNEVFKPLYDKLGEVLHKHGAPSEMAGDMMQLLARYKATEVADGMSKAKAELETVPNWDSRLSTVSRALDARLPAEHATALKSAIHSADALKALEKLVSPGGPRTTTPSPAANGLDQITDPSARLRAARQAGR